MKTLNERIQDLRKILVTCYNAIKRKGGTIPEAGERNMYNLPEAVRSIPQEHTELTELMVTANGVYFPADHDADGFSKVIANFDTSSLGKVQVESLKISDTCIYNGVWENSLLIDFSKVTSMQNVFRKCITLEQMEVNGWNINENPISFASTFQECSSLKRFDFSKSNKVKPTLMSLCFGSCTSLNTIIGLDKFDTSLCTDFTQTFYLVPALECDITSWDFSNAVNTDSIFLWSKFNTIVGGRDLDTVIRDNICAFNNVTCNVQLFSYNTSPPLDIASLRAVINGLADVNDQPAESRPTLTLGTTLMSKLETEDPDSITIATEKGWNLA